MTTPAFRNPTTRTLSAPALPPLRAFLTLAFGLIATVADDALAQSTPATQPAWTLVAPGVWKTTVGKAEDLTLLSAAGIQPQATALAAMPAAEFPLNAKEIASEAMRLASHKLPISTKFVVKEGLEHGHQ